VDSREFVYSKFREYYTDPSTEIPEPLCVEQREFAYLSFKERFMMRHKRFGDFNAFTNLLKENTPSDVYHSIAYYENPDFDMDKKGWLGADLVFDIDADHIPSSCDKIHDEWKCNKCGFSGKGVTPEVCPACEGQKFETKTWPCELCIKAARDETSKLLDMLSGDFGFSDKELRVFFSGHRGYHVYVENDAIKSLDAMGRKEIVDYVMGTGLAILEKDDEPVKSKRKKKGPAGFSLHDYGWNRRLKLGMQKFIARATKEDLKNVGLTTNYSAVLDNKALISKCISEGRWTGVNGVSVQTWRKIAAHVKDLETSAIDTVVTTDIHRLIRMNGTLHGKTGLKKVEFPAKELETFDPFSEAVAFKKGEVKVLIDNAPKFNMSGTALGPFKNEVKELPTAAAVMLICKGRAKVAE
jgi:DNA primase small subunit